MKSKLKTLKFGNWSYIEDTTAITEEDAGMASAEKQAELMGRFISADTCPMLKELSLSEIRSIPLHPFWKALQDSKTIHTFRWLGGHRALRCSCQRWAGEQSQYYRLRMPNSIPRDEFLAGLSFQNLHHVELDALVRTTGVEQLRFLSQCPELRTLVWNVDSDYPSKKAGELFRKNTWPHLHSLDLVYYDLLDEDMALALNYIGGSTQNGQLQRIVTNSPAIGVITFASLKRHYMALQHLEIHANFTSLMLQEILSSCPKLRVLRGNKIITDDIVNGQPWVCHGLEELELGVVVNIDPLSQAPADQGQEEEVDQHGSGRQCKIERAIYERLGSLSRLRKLTLRQTFYTQDAHHALRFTLCSGLDKLAGLKELRLLRVCQDFMVAKDLQMMLGYWPRLETLEGNLRGPPEDKSVLRNIMVGRNIKYSTL
ncbi:hypothetical protein BGX28_008297 [Mortierella sp. GBA30]|nr:hypothetical protein BGX28_008297 [Mortierella sp. GBA30]